MEGYNEGNTLILEIEGLAYADEKIVVTPVGVTSVTSVTGVTSSTPTGVTGVTTEKE